MRRLLVQCLAGFLVALIAGSVTTGYAFARRVHSSICGAVVPADIALTNVSLGAFNSNNTSDSSVQCSMIEDNSLDAVSVTAIEVQVGDGSTSGSVVASACYVEETALSGSCGTSDASSNGGTGADTLTPPDWDSISGYDIGDFAFINVVLCDNGDPGPCSVRGYRVSS